MDSDQATISIRHAITKVLHRDIPDVSDDMRLFEDLAFDSTSIIELLMEIEDQTGVVIDPDELSEGIFHTVGTITNYVTNNLSRDVHDR